MIKSARNASGTLRAAVALTLLTAGCTPKPLVSTIAYENQGGKSIAFLTPYIPSQETMLSAAPVTAAGTIAPAFGIIGGLIGGSIEADEQQKRQTDFTDLLSQKGFQPQTILTGAILQQLKTEGYTVSQISVARPGADFLTAYPQSQVPQLDVVLVQDGYYRLTDKYQPIIELKYRLVAKDGTTTLAQGAFQYSSNRGDNTPDTAYDYEKYAYFSTEPGLAVQALTTVLTQAGTSVAQGMN